MKAIKTLLLIKTIWTIVEAALLIALGIVVLANYNNQDGRNIIGLVAGILIIVDGALRLALYFLDVASQEQKTGLVAGVGELSIGIFLCITPYILVDFLSLVMVLLILVIGAVLIVDALAKTLRRKVIPVPPAILVALYSIGVILLAAGIAGLVLYFGESAGDVKNILLIIIGVLLIVSGVFEIGFSIGTIIAAMKAKDIEEEVIAAEHEEKRSK